MRSPGGRARIALLLVSHSVQLADGARELAMQMAPGVLIYAVGGRSDGGLGTDFDRALSTLEEAGTQADGVVVLADLGSAVLTVGTVLEFAEDELAARTRLADSPFVEGTVAAAVTAHGGGDLSEVLRSAEHAGSTFAPQNDSDVVADPQENPMPGVTTPQQVEVRNPLGLHARPAALLARLVASFDAVITIGGVNAASVLELMKLGAVGGQKLEVTAQGAHADAAIAAVVAEIEGGFGEI